MKIAYIDICGFRGYQKPVRFEFSEGFTIIDGRNGVGKSTVFDAVEFALTGTISKYLDAKSAGESVENYIWWSGFTPGAHERYVEVGFRYDDQTYAIRRTPLDAKNKDLGAIRHMLVDETRAPNSAIEQLCAATIIRDEHIARLSLDLKEVDRFTLLRDAIGAVDADQWINRAQKLYSTTSARARIAQDEVTAANSALSAARLRIDQTRSALPLGRTVGQALERLQNVLQTTVPAESLGDFSRVRLGEISQRIRLLQDILKDAEHVELTRDGLPALQYVVDTTTDARLAARQTAEKLELAIGEAPVSSLLSQQARQLERLVEIGRTLGTREGKCPLCSSEIDHEHFEQGIAAALEFAKKLDTNAVEQAQRERMRDAAVAELAQVEAALSAALIQQAHAQVEINEFEQRCADAEIDFSSLSALSNEITELMTKEAAILVDLNLIDNVGFNRLLVRAIDDDTAAKERVVQAEAKLGRARLAETRAKAIFDATRRAAAETLDQRLDRVLPLMSELYKRLRPHPIWNDIQYSVRGDVRRFLKLQVGDDINPQFTFSSGQRRATGLAFLLSINLSISWGHWQSILLDDPVQHVDDFRTVHLSEVLSHLCAGGRQIICAVEDSALADLMCRRLPTTQQNPGKRITLGADQDGAVTILSERVVPPLMLRALPVNSTSLTA